MRARRKKWAEEELRTNEKVVQEPKNKKGRWSEIFGNDNPIYLEVGCGKGQFIRENSKRYKDINFIALERELNVICMAVRDAEEAGDNLKFIVGDVKDLEEYFAEDELSRLYINFCDPWDRKRKWAKRRLTHGTFLDIYTNLLNKDGEIHFKTDNTILFESSLNQISDKNWKMKNISLDLHKSGLVGNIMTEYEEKFSRKGMQIYRLEAENPRKKDK